MAAATQTCERAAASKTGGCQKGKAGRQLHTSRTGSFPNGSAGFAPRVAARALRMIAGSICTCHTQRARAAPARRRRRAACQHTHAASLRGGATSPCSMHAQTPRAPPRSARLGPKRAAAGGLILVGASLAARLRGGREASAGCEGQLGAHHVCASLGVSALHRQSGALSVATRAKPHLGAQRRDLSLCDSLRAGGVQSAAGC